MSDVKPALDAESWRANLAEERDFKVAKSSPGLCYLTNVEGIWGRMGLAALCLHDQPGGFTREDVAFLREHVRERSGHGETPPHLDPFVEIADRIEALLSPEES